MVPNLQKFSLDFFFFSAYVVAKAMHIHSVEMYFEFWIFFSRLATCDMILSYDAAQQAPAPRQPHRHEGKQLIQSNYSVPIQPLCFSLLVQRSVNYMRYPTLCHKVGFLLDDFALVLANVNVPSMLKGGLG